MSDRKYFGYYPLAQAKAYLRGATEVSGIDLMILKNYLWSQPEEIPLIEQTLVRMCQNPLLDKLNEIIGMATESFQELVADAENKKAFIKFRAEFLRLYDRINELKIKADSNKERADIQNAVSLIEDMSQTAHQKAGFTYASLEELKLLQ